MADDYTVRGIIYSPVFDGAGGWTSLGGDIQISPDGNAGGAEHFTLGGPSKRLSTDPDNPGDIPNLPQVTIEQYISRVTAILHAYCFGLHVILTVRNIPDQSFPRILAIDLES